MSTSTNSHVPVRATPLPPMPPRFDGKEHQFVGALFVINARQLHRIARIAKVDEPYPLHDTAIGHIEAGNNALGEALSRADGRHM